MTYLPIYVVSIGLNEEKFVRRWAESARGADGIFLLDTGSTDNTKAVAEECGVMVFEKVFTPWRFDHARNHLLSLLPDDDAWLINLDLDEILVGDWLDTIRSVPVEFNRIRYNYIWNWNEDGTPGKSYHGDKIVRRHTHRWKHPVHEVNVTVDGYWENQFFAKGFEIHHHADNNKSRGQYLNLLLLSVDEDPEDDRNTYYCARELYFNGMNEQAVALFRRHLTMERSKWAPERAYSMRYLAKMLPDEREAWLLRAVAEYDAREPWLDLASHYYDNKDWLACRWAALRCLRHEERPSLYLNEPEAWGERPYDLLAIASYYLEMYDDAAKYGQIACDMAPNDKRLEGNLFFYKYEGPFPVKNRTVVDL